MRVLMLILGLLSFGTAPVWAEGTGENASIDLAPAIAALNADPLGADLLPRCPADIQDTQMGWQQKLLGLRGGWLRARCRDKLDGCITACTKDRHATACLSLAQLLEPSGTDTRDMARRSAYALACALGKASGCTNRGATLRNAARDDDQITYPNDASLDHCLLRSFEGACRANDAWGCAMAGQAHRFGQGTPANLKIASARFTQTCVLSNSELGKESASAPCRFAQRQLKLLGPDSEETGQND